MFHISDKKGKMLICDVLYTLLFLCERFDQVTYWIEWWPQNGDVYLEKKNTLQIKYNKCWIEHNV